MDQRTQENDNLGYASTPSEPQAAPDPTAWMNLRAFYGSSSHRAIELDPQSESSDGDSSSEESVSARTGRGSTLGPTQAGTSNNGAIEAPAYGPAMASDETEIYMPDGTRRKFCAPCGTWVNLGAAKTSIHAYLVHTSSVRCKRNALTFERRIRVDGTGSLASSVVARKTSATTTGDVECTIQPSGPGPSSSGSVDMTGVSVSATPDTPGAASLLSLQLPPPTAAHTSLHTGCSPIIPSSPLLHRGGSETDLQFASTCNGIQIAWPHGNAFRTYPFAIHAGESLGFVVCGIGNQGASLFVQSDACHGQIVRPGEVCISCAKISTSKNWKAIENRAVVVAKHTPWALRSHDQMCDLASGLGGEVNRLRARVSHLAETYIGVKITYQKDQDSMNTVRRESTRKKLDDFKRFTMAIATLDVPRLRQLVSVAVRQGSSTEAIISRMRDSHDLIYHPRGYSDRELDTAYLVAHLGGGMRLSHALNHSRDYGGPSSRTVHRNRAVQEVQPCVSAPKEEEIAGNISAFFGEVAVPLVAAKSGWCFMVDGVASEQRAAYSRATNEIVGLCREHSGALDLHVVSLEAVQRVAAALNKEEPTCHYAKECTVGAFAPFRNDNYHAIPIFISPTCKAETAVEMAVWMRMVLEQWRLSPNGAVRHGDVWCVATDGDGTFRRAKWALLMAQKLDASSKLYEDLSRLGGMNLYTGEGEVTADADFKHVFKRFATLLRSSEGILVQDTTVNQDCLVRHLVKLPGLNAMKVAELVDPADHQNVPKAVSLLQHVIKLKSRPVDTFNPSELKAHHALSLFADVIHSFLEPFINLSLSLSNQLSLLSRYAHLACIMYRRHRTSFMTSQLYIDTQMIVKSIYFSVKKQQVLDDSKPFYIIHDGTDRLEMTFCDVRTQDHARNFDALALSRKLSISANINAILLRRPELNRGHRRIKLSSKVGPDHVNPASTKGDLIVSHVSLQHCWERGREEADVILKQRDIVDVSFDKLWKIPNLDLLRPLGDGKYVGVSSLDIADRSIPLPSPIPQPTQSTSDLTDPDSPTAYDIADDLEDLVATEVMDKHTSASDWVEVMHEDGTCVFYHKASLIRIIIRKLDGGRIMIDRLLRNQGVKRDRFKEEAKVTAELTDLVQFYTGDIGAGLVRCGSMVVLAIVEVTSLLANGQRVSSVPVDHLGTTKTPLTIAGQVLDICVDTQTERSTNLWVWLGAFLQVKETSARTSSETAPGRVAATQVSQFLVHFPGWLFFPISPDMIAVDPNSPRTFGAHKPPVTWQFNANKLSELVTDLWANVTEFTESLSDAVDEIATVIETDTFPYRDTHRQPAFFVENLPTDLRVQKLTRDHVVPCFLCGKDKVKIQSMRSHVGGHILRSQVGITEKLKQQPGSIAPCGFCGLDGCSILLSMERKKVKMRSSCPYHYDFNYGAALNSTINGPSTNVPVFCPLCPANPITQQRPTFWKYNLETHFQGMHPSSLKDTDDPASWKDVAAAAQVKHVTKEEAKRLGVTSEAYQAYRDLHSVPGSDDVARMVERAKGLEEDEGTKSDAMAARRKRAGTSTVGGTQLPHSKRVC